MSGIASTKLYVQVAILRHRVILRQLVRRVLAGALAVAAFIVTAGLSTYALFLAIRSQVGDLGSVLAITGIYLVIAVILVLYTLHEPISPELDALAEMEAAALESAIIENREIIQAVSAAGHRIQDFRNTFSLGIGVLSALRRLLATAKEH